MCCGMLGEFQVLILDSRAVPWPWEERHGQSRAWEWHGKCESDTATLCKSNGMTHSKSLVAQHGRGTACYVWIGLNIAPRAAVATLTPTLLQMCTLNLNPDRTTAGLLTVHSLNICKTLQNPNHVTYQNIYCIYVPVTCTEQYFSQIIYISCVLHGAESFLRN
jgi:hypothetical protein